MLETAEKSTFITSFPQVKFSKGTNLPSHLTFEIHHFHTLLTSDEFLEYFTGAISKCVSTKMKEKLFYSPPSFKFSNLKLFLLQHFQTK